MQGVDDDGRFSVLMDLMDQETALIQRIKENLRNMDI